MLNVKKQIVFQYGWYCLATQTCLNQGLLQSIKYIPFPAWNFGSSTWGTSRSLWVSSRSLYKFAMKFIFLQTHITSRLLTGYIPISFSIESSSINFLRLRVMETLSVFRGALVMDLLLLKLLRSAEHGGVAFGSSPLFPRRFLQSSNHPVGNGFLWPVVEVVSACDTKVAALADK